MKYVELLKQSEAEKEAGLVEAHAAQQAAELGLAITKKEIEIKGLEIDLTKTKGQLPIDLNSIMDASDRLEWAKRQLATLNALKDELF